MRKAFSTLAFTLCGVLLSTALCLEAQPNAVLTVSITSTTPLASSPRTILAMSDQVEKRRLKRKRLREAEQAKFDSQITELAEKAAAYDYPMQDSSDSDCDITMWHSSSISAVNLLGRPSLSPLASFSNAVSMFDSLPSQSANSEVPSTSVYGECQPASTIGNDLPHNADSEVSTLIVNVESAKTSEESGFDFQGDELSDEEAYCYDSESDSTSVAQESALKEGLNSASGFEKKLVNWAFDHYITHSALDDLLVILRDEGHPSLPKLAATLLQTPRSTSSQVRVVGGGDYWYRGLLPALELHFKPSMATNQNQIVIDFFIDGLSPYNSPSKNVHLWPIAGRIISDQVKTAPFVIALWCGSTKEPGNIDEFLNPFVEECQKLMQGFRLNGSEYKLVVKNLIGDAPARSMLKKVNPHNSKVCCERCEARCVYVQNRMVFAADCVCRARTDESFRLRSDPPYHKVETSSPLEKLMKMVSQFPLEPLHLVDFDTFKKKVPNFESLVQEVTN